jgi:Uma2 family endonuclease
MASLPSFPLWTEEAYLEYENSSSTRHEFYAGMVVAMAGGSENHALLATNFLIDLGNQLEDSPCRPVSHDVRLANPESKSYFYPDLLVRCPESDSETAALEARVVIEILSPSTEAIDREFKRRAYQSSASIRDYLMVSQDKMRIEHDTREHAESPWRHVVYTTPEALIPLPSIGCVLQAGRVYRRIALA